MLFPLVILLLSLITVPAVVFKPAAASQVAIFRIAWASMLPPDGSGLEVGGGFAAIFLLFIMLMHAPANCDDAQAMWLKCDGAA